MSELREVEKIHDAVREDSAGLVTRRALPTRASSMLDPFLFLNHHGPRSGIAQAIKDYQTGAFG